MALYTRNPSSVSSCRFLTVFLLSTLALTGCARLTPKTTALKVVHQAYRDEFDRFMVPPPTDKPGIRATAANEPVFVETLRAIRDYRTKYGEDSQEAAHLKVLEGMIYIQSGQSGMARLIAEDVKNAGAKLKSGTGRYTRDQLLSAAFEFLLKGWQEIYESSDLLPNGQENDATITEFGKLEEAADGIKGVLDGLDKSKLAQPEVDEGAVYLAATAAIFYAWVYALKRLEDTGFAALPVTQQKEYLAKGRDLIGRFLSETEKKAASEANTGNSPIGRIRYLQWYSFLSQKVNSPQ